ncbi:hypothetical protein LTR66_011134 [Elasticomyces elasticus]|nr:hypothetical protein LTR66_011134 [Elasticomyces elasticus]
MFSPFNPRLLALITICSLLLPTIFAQTSPSPSPSPSTTSVAAVSSSSSSPSSTATVAPGTSGYSYIGCYNETTGIAGSGGVRALVGGKMVPCEYRARLDLSINRPLANGAVSDILGGE